MGCKKVPIFLVKYSFQKIHFLVNLGNLGSNEKLPPLWSWFYLSCPFDNNYWFLRPIKVTRTYLEVVTDLELYLAEFFSWWGWVIWVLDDRYVIHRHRPCSTIRTGTIVVCRTVATSRHRMEWGTAGRGTVALLWKQKQKERVSFE